MPKLVDLYGALLGTHDGVFHSDDVHVVALLEKMGIAGRIVRTRNPEILRSCDIRADVGGEYNPETCDFDHHNGETSRRPNGNPRSAIGLVWMEVGHIFCGSPEVAGMVDLDYIQPIDVRDCGTKRVPKAGVDNTVYTTGDVVSRRNPSAHLEVRDFDLRFRETVEMAKIWLQDALEHACGEIDGRTKVREYLASREDSRILVIPQYCSWSSTVQNEGRGVQAVVFLSDDNTGWKVKSQTGRLPKAWAGKKGGDLVATTGVEDALFCSDTGHIAGTTSRDGAYKLAQLVVAG